MKTCTFDDWDRFNRRWHNGDYPCQRYGQAFVNEFCREPGDVAWPELFYASHETALGIIWTQAIS